MKRKSGHRALQRVEFLWPERVMSAVDEYARRSGVDRTAAVLGIVEAALHERAQRRLEDVWRASGIEAQVDALRGRLEALDMLSREVARSTFGIEALLLDWYVRTGAKKVSEDDLAEVVRRAGEDAVAQLLDEMGRRSKGEVGQQEG